MSSGRQDWNRGGRFRWAILLILHFTLACSSPVDKATDRDVSDAVTDVTDVIAPDIAGEDTGGVPDVEVPSVEIPEGCNPVAFEHDCLMPFPSNVFLVDDPSLPSGMRVEVPSIALPETSAGQSVDLLHEHRIDGFSHHMPIAVYFSDVVDTSELVFHDDDPAPTLAPTSSTIIIEIGAGQGNEAIPHWAEVDYTRVEDGERIFYLRTHNRLKNGTRYIVALQDLKNRAGEVLPVPEGFRHIRDGVRGAHPRLDDELERFEAEIFPHLEAFGVDRGNLQLAWDFTTQTMEHVTADLVFMRNHLLDYYAEQAPAVTITAVDEDVNAQVARRVRGTITVPLYLEHPRVDARISRDEDENVLVNGTFEVPFTVIIPYSVMEREAGEPPIRMIQYGHGFFGQRVEIETGYVRQFAQDMKVVVMAVDWIGMALEDSAKVADNLVNRTENTLRFIDRVHQGIVNQLALTEAARTTFRDLEEFKHDGALVYDPGELYYYGISQGHIFGTTMLALSAVLDRAVVGVGGASYALMMSRSGSFRTLLQLALFKFDSAREVQKFLTMSQLVFDRVDPITYAPMLFDDPLEGSPGERRLLMHIGIGDTDVPNVASHLHVRSLGIPQLLPVPRSIPLIDTIEGPVDGSAMVEIDYGVDPLPDYYALIPPAAEATGVHEAVRRNPRVLEQIDLFLRPGGLIVHTCDGPCNPE